MQTNVFIALVGWGEMARQNARNAVGHHSEASRGHGISRPNNYKWIFNFRQMSHLNGVCAYGEPGYNGTVRLEKLDVVAR